MKGKSKYLVLLLLLLVVCSGLVTYALFRTNKSGNANVNAARWNVVFKNGEEEISNNFNISLEDAEWTNELGNVASGKIAPGSQATFYITIDATGTETDVDYTAEIDDSFNESDFEVTLAQDSGTIPYSTVENAMIRQIPIRVVWNGNINDSNTKNNDDLLKKARDITIPIKITAAQKLALRYTVTFNDGNGHTLSTRKVDEGSTIGTLPTNPSRIGYTFTGWFDAEENGNEVTADTLATPGMVIYAKWNEKYVTVTFDSNGGSAVSSQQIQEGSVINSIPLSLKENSELSGWYDSSNNKLTTSTQIMENITYTARWIASQYVDFYYDSSNINNPSPFTYTASNTGTYKLEVWGAQGANSGGLGGLGGYSTGTIHLDANDTLYVVVGTQGNGSTGGYNGGGTGSNRCKDGDYYKNGGGGGGATHIAINHNLGELKLYNSNQSDILIVAGGGGGGAYITGNYNGGAGGGLSGKNGTGRSITPLGGTQNSGYSFGLGQNGGSCYGNTGDWGESGRGAGGGGYYGGSASQIYANGIAGGAGGSGYIGGVNEGYTIDGDSSMPSPDWTFKTGRTGNGYARISYLGE